MGMDTVLSLDKAMSTPTGGGHLAITLPCISPAIRSYIPLFGHTYRLLTYRRVAFDTSGYDNIIHLFSQLAVVLIFHSSAPVSIDIAILIG